MSAPSNPFHIVEAAPEHGSLLTALFERECSGCFCRYWHFRGDKNAWLDRSANAPGENRAEMLDALAVRSDDMRGMVALADDTRAVGFMKLCPAAAVEKLYAQRIYRALPCFDGERDGVYTIGCFLVDSELRGRGLAHLLVRGGIVAARRWGARAIEAFPRRTESAHAHELWTGPASVFFAAGFHEVHAFAPYPVLRLEL